MKLLIPKNKLEWRTTSKKPNIILVTFFLYRVPINNQPLISINNNQPSYSAVELVTTRQTAHITNDEWKKILEWRKSNSPIYYNSPTYNSKNIHIHNFIMFLLQTHCLVTGSVLWYKYFLDNYTVITIIIIIMIFNQSFILTCKLMCFLC